MNLDLLNIIKYEDVFEGIRKYGKNVCPLRTLVDVLEKRPDNILELMQEDSFQSVVFPKVLFSPKFIIEYMRNVYTDMLTDSSNLVYLIYKYNSDDEEKKYVFSNNMTIYDDVITICYLYCIMTSKSEYKESRPVIDLREIMKKKYTIWDDLDISQSSAEHDYAEKVTWFRIAHSFPSITFAIFHHDIIDVSISLCTTFPNDNLPKIFNVPFLAPIVPRFLEDVYTPLAMLMAFAVLIDNNEECRRGEKTPLDRLWKETNDLYTCDVYPTFLKYQLCWKWGIIELVDNEFVYTRYFNDVCVEALDLISYLRPDDPYLRRLSFIFNMPFLEVE